MIKTTMEEQTEGRCPNCGEPVRPNWRVCPACETRLQQQRQCPGCGTPVKQNWRRCPECETAIDLPPAEPDRPRQKIYAEPVCGIELVLVNGGAFDMGDTFDSGLEDEKPVHTVELDSFYIGRFPVTQAQWMKLIPDNPAQFKDPEAPVEQVTWEDARGFARRLTEACGGRKRFRLPTEAEWEYAARSGGQSQVYAGGFDIDAVAWYEANSDGRTHPVGRRAPNDLGIFDMSGNVWEWCEDAFVEDAYQRHRRRNPLTSGRGAEERVIRGGSFNLDAWSARCCRRFRFTAGFFGPGLGFRLVMEKI